MSAGGPRIVVDRDRCVGAGMCALTAPDVFDQDDEGVVVVRTPAPAGDAADAAAEAVGLCPSGAVALTRAA
jgi:ferredoxin